MIDIEHENLIPIRDVPRHIPPRKSGRRVHISAVYRWMSRGVRGVRLEAIKIGGTTYTSSEAIQKFADRLSATDPHTRPAASSMSASRQRQIDAATKEVESILGDTSAGTSAG